MANRSEDTIFGSPPALWSKAGGAEGVRTPDLLNAIQALYQLSYDPIEGGKNVRVAPQYCQNPNWNDLERSEDFWQT